MGRAELKRLTVERFKSYSEPASLEIAPLTILLGRNNSGKSSLIQALLLLKQTLAYPRSDVPLHLEGHVEAIHLRELTFGWPDVAESVEGPAFTIVWESDVDVKTALDANGRLPDLDHLRHHSGIRWITDLPHPLRLETTFKLSYRELKGRVLIDRIDLRSVRVDSGMQASNPQVKIRHRPQTDLYRLSWYAGYSGVDWDLAHLIDVKLDHFIPLVSIDKRGVGPRTIQRTYHNGFKVLYEQPLEDLRRLLVDFHYLGSARIEPPSIYRPASVPPEEVGVSGQYAAQMLQARKIDVVHFVPPLALDDGKLRFPERALSRSLVDAFNVVLHELGVAADLRIHEIENVGFRLLFGGASLQHVGRGIGYLLPAVVLGLVSDPLRFDEPSTDLDLVEYLDQCPTLTHAALEEPEKHLHPKVQTRLAHWFIALAMAGRRLLVETHSDHLVRRLRGLIARASSGSDLEKWLAKNIVIAEVEQTDDGQSHLTCSRLTKTGGIAERWPADFIDEGTDEERSIYYASLEKSDGTAAGTANTQFVHDPVDD